MLSKEKLKKLNEFFENGVAELNEENGKSYFVRTEECEEVRTFLFEHLYCSNDFNVLTKKQLTNNKFKVSKKIETFGIIRAYVEKHGNVLYV